MKQSKYVKNLSKNEMRLIAKMRGINVRKSISKTELFRILKKEDKITYKESPFKSIVEDIRSKLSKSGDRLIEKALYYVEEIKKLSESQVKNIKEKLIKFQNELIRKNIIKKDNDIYNAWYYGSITYNGIKDIRYLFNEDEDVDEDNDVDKEKITYLESPFKSLIEDMRSKLSKSGDKLI